MVYFVNARPCVLKEDCYPAGIYPPTCGNVYSCSNGQCILAAVDCITPNNLTDYYSKVDYSCSQNSDCAIKDVHKCCGANFECVNKNAFTYPDFVRAQCEKEEVSSTCNVNMPKACACYNSKCIEDASGGPICGNGICEYPYECSKDCDKNTDCKNLYWIDNENMECGQKEFCGMYMYQGLQTFESKGQCKKAVDVICVEKNGSCCLGEVCNNVNVNCVLGTYAVFNGCDDNCIADWECKKNCPAYSLPLCSKGTEIVASRDENGCPKPKCEIKKNWCIERTNACTKEYNPVCGCFIARTLVATDDNLETCETYSNSCVACSENSDYWTSGECKSKIEKTCPAGATNEDGVCNYILSNGRKAEIKIMPETASDNAIKRLGELNFTIELKEVGKEENNGGKIAEKMFPIYELTGNKEGKFLGIFKIIARVQAQVDAETGEVTKVIKPWWSFLATWKSTTVPIDKPDPKKIDNNLQVGEGAKDVVEANNLFSFDLYNKYKSKEGNIFFSPYSISSALAMTYEGARGKTAEEMQSLLHFPRLDILRLDSAKIYSDLNKESKQYMLSTANALWAQKDYPFKQDYFQTVDTYYNGKVTNLDFKKDTENSRVTINNWVEDKTNDKIKDLIPKGILTPDTRLVLTNALYFKANWSRKFEADNTAEGRFKLDSGNDIYVMMMHQTDDFGYAETKNIQILEMDYIGKGLSMLIILPKENDLSSIEDSISGTQIANWKKTIKNEEVRVTVPKFKFETKYFMADDLKEMGMHLAFNPDLADFTGMWTRQNDENLYISEVIHQTFIEVGEAGTEAAAATAVIMAETTAIGPGEFKEPKVFNADHPFIFIIQQKDTGNILFMGRMSDPSK